MSFKGLVNKINEEVSPMPRAGSLPVLPKIDPEIAAQRAAILFGCYRRADANDPDVYAAAVAAILSEYDEETVIAVTDPRTGIARRSNFLPTINEIDKACVERRAFQQRRDWLVSKGWRFEGGNWIKPEAA